jgi:redox-sensitive bicupin YhaK (pirin superfamily)
VYVYRGEVSIAGKAVPTQRMAILANEPRSDGVVIQASTDARLLLIAGKPLKEPIVQYGPFVMNTQDEIRQAMSDYRAGRLGETAK